MNKLFIYIFILGLVFAFVVPPFQKPDETTHFKKALSVSYGIFGCQKNDRGEILVQSGFVNLLNDQSLQKIIQKKYLKLDLVNYLTESLKYQTKKYKLLKIDNICRLPFYPYLFLSFGILIGRILGFNPFITFLVGRFTNFIILFAWFYYIFKKTGKTYQPILFVTFFLPMTIHQLTSFSYDGFQILTALTIFSIFTRIIEKKLKLLKGISIILLLIIIFLAARSAIKVPLPIFARPALQQQFLISNPLFFLEMIIKTSYSRGIFYIQSMIGTFGWLEYGLYHWLTLLYLSVIIVVIMFTKISKNQSAPPWLILIIFAGLISVYTGIITLNYIVWTPYRASLADGVQGRYFLPFFPFMIYALINLKNYLLPKINIYKIKMKPLFVYLILAITLVTMIRIIVLRFYIF